MKTFFKLLLLQCYVAPSFRQRQVVNLNAGASLMVMGHAEDPQSDIFITFLLTNSIK